MDRHPLTHAYLKLHTAIFLFGFTAILGKLISLEQMSLVWNRMWISFLGLAILPGVFSGSFKLPRKEVFMFSGIGILVALHWVTFYGSIKLGNNASVTLACLATSPLFTSIIEPIIVKRKILMTEVVLGMVTILGVYFVTGAGKTFYPAILTGVISALLAATFSTLNKKFIAGHNALSVSFLELFSGWVFLSILIPVYFFSDPSFHLLPDDRMLSQPWNFTFLHIHSDWYYLLVLGLLCTCLAFVFNLQALRHVSAFTSNLSINLEPVYGIIMAAWFFKENDDLNFRFYLGAGIILSCVLLHPLLNRIEKRKLRS